MKTGKFPAIEFKQTSQLNPYWSSWSCFYEAIKGRNGLSKKTIKKYFDKLVDKKDYLRKERVGLLNYLYSLPVD